MDSFSPAQNSINRAITEKFELSSLINIPTLKSPGLPPELKTVVDIRFSVEIVDPTGYHLVKLRS